MTNIVRLLLTVITVAMLYMTAYSVQAADVRDEVVKVTKDSGVFSVKLTTRIYAPRGDGPFRIVVINHGKAHGISSLQADRGFYAQSLEFVRRGYMVVVPTRSGFGSSGGSYIGNCAVETMGYAYADDVESAINYARTLPYADPHHIVVLGQSQGGLAALALGARNVDGVAGVINMAGGDWNATCSGDNNFFSVLDAFKTYGEKTKVPVLFMYGETDEYFPGDRPKRLFDAYNSKGGHAQFFNTGSFRGDSHPMFNRLPGIPIWVPVIGNFFRSLGWNWDVKYDLRKPGAYPDIEDIDAVPYQDMSKLMWEKCALFLLLDPRPIRAFAISPDGKFGLAHGENAAMKALSACREDKGADCQLYAVGNEVVYRGVAAESKAVQDPVVHATKAAAGEGKG